MDIGKWNSFPALKTAEQLNEYFDSLNKDDKKYYHYTPLGAINAILGSKSFVISAVSRFNDKTDREQFGNENEQRKFFSLCFSRGTEENLSLWYLYSGVDGKGGRLGFTHNKIKRLLSDTLDICDDTSDDKLRFSLWEYDYDHHKKIKRIKPLEENKHMTIKLRDVLYYRVGGKKARLKYNTLTNNAIQKGEVEKYIKGNKGFNKNLIWYYEKEERLLIEITDELAKEMKPGKEYAVICRIDDIIKHAKITTAPEINDREELKGYPYIENFLFDSSNVGLSEYHGDITMRLCEKCKYRNYKEKICPTCDKGKSGKDN